MRKQHTGGSRSRFATLFWGLVLTAGLAGCSDNPEPEPLEDTAAASTTPSPSPSKTRSPDAAPTMPPEARGTSKQAAIAFVEHVIQVLNYTAKSLDTGALSRVSAKDCAACESIAESVEQLRSRGGSITGGEWTPLQVRVFPGNASGVFRLEAVVEATAQVVRSTPGGDRVDHPAGRTVYLFDVEPSRAGWRVLRIQGDGS